MLLFPQISKLVVPGPSSLSWRGLAHCIVLRRREAFGSAPDSNWFFATDLIFVTFSFERMAIKVRAPPQPRYRRVVSETKARDIANPSIVYHLTHTPTTPPATPQPTSSTKRSSPASSLLSSRAASSRSSSASSSTSPVPWPSRSVSSSACSSRTVAFCRGLLLLATPL